jgi:hypothetical protein
MTNRLKWFLALLALLPIGLANAPARAAELRLISLKCHKTNDRIGPDSARLEAGGRTVWGPQSMSKGQTRDLSQVPVIKFRRSVLLELFDEDPFADDSLGEQPITADQADGGEKTVEFTDDGAHYTLRYRVRP